jgi:hypothetical protein
MGDKEFHEILGLIVDSSEKAVSEIVHAANVDAKKTALRKFANDHNIVLEEQDIDDLSNCTFEIGLESRKITVSSPRN